MITIGQLVKDISQFLMDLLTPGTFTIAVAVIASAWKFYKKIKVKLIDSNDANMSQIQQQLSSVKDSIETFQQTADKNYKDIQMEVLRLEILEGMDSHRLSESEVRHFYDKYSKMGGDSFVTDKVHAYIEALRKDDDHE